VRCATVAGDEQAAIATYATATLVRRRIEEPASDAMAMRCASKFDLSDVRRQRFVSACSRSESS
jgi:hypothetical protein